MQIMLDAITGLIEFSIQDSTMSLQRCQEWKALSVDDNFLMDLSIIPILFFALRLMRIAQLHCP